jgi:hypothetical protein
MIRRKGGEIMSLRQEALMEDFKKEFHKRVMFLKQALSIIIPLSEEDKAIFENGMATLIDLDEELQNAETVREISKYVDLDEAEKSWEIIKRELDVCNVSEKTLISPKWEGRDS